MRSPYFVGAKLRDSLPLSDIELPDIFSFRNRHKRINRICVDLLVESNSVI